MMMNVISRRRRKEGRREGRKEGRKEGMTSAARLLALR